MSGTILLAGATGLIGSRVASLLVAETSIEGPVVTPVRRQPEGQLPKLIPVVGDLSDDGGAVSESLRVAAGGRAIDSYITCLGTTMKNAGSEEAFIAVDRDLVLRFARIAKDLGAKQAVLVSSVGASARSGNFYLKVKGETEESLLAMGFARTDILRPGLLLGPRSESRPGEHFAQLLAPIYNPILLGSLRKYRAIDAESVAAAIVELVRRGGSGRAVHEHDSILELARAGRSARRIDN